MSANSPKAYVEVRNGKVQAVDEPPAMSSHLQFLVTAEMKHAGAKIQTDSRSADSEELAMKVYLAMAKPDHGL